ncbi:MAG: amino acid ABC transporter permease [Promethearchaeota archaeon]
MLFQVNLGYIALIISNLKSIIIPCILFLIGILLMRWYARKKHKPYSNVWDTSLKTSAIVNIVWLIKDIPTLYALFPLFYENIIPEIISTSINILIGIFVIMLIYKKEFRESIVFVIVIQLILFFITLILGFVFSFIATPPYIFLFIVINGLPQTLILTVLGLIFGFLLGISLAIMRVYGGVELRIVGIGYEKLFRGIPLLVLIYLFYFGIPNISPLNSVVLALAVRSGAYQSQIFRGAILSVNPGQIEAAYSVGMTRFQAFRHILMPQALRLALPSWSNEYAVVIKDSSFAFEVGIIEMTRAAYYVSVSFRELWALSMGVVAITYFLFTFPITKLFGERQTKKLKKLGMGGG